MLASLVLAVLTTASPATLLRDLIREEWEFRIREDPLVAAAVGDPRGADRLPSLRPENLEGRARFDRRILERLHAIDRGALAGDDRINYDMLVRDVEDRLGAHGLGLRRIPFTSDSGFHIDFARLPREAPLATVADYENYIARLRASREYFAQNIHWMREGIRTGFTMPRIVLEGYDRTMRSHVVDDPTQSAFFAPFRTWPAGVPNGERRRLTDAGTAAVRDFVVPAYRDLLDFMVRTYQPAARVTTGASDLPRGREFYAHQVKRFTTLDVTPEDVHTIGLREVERIRAEMMEVIREVGFDGDLEAFIEFLRTDPRFYPKTAGELLREAAFIAKKMDGKLPALFGRLPRLPYGIEPVPDELAPKFTGGRYAEAPIGSTRAGYYWVNTYNLAARPLYVLEALTLHEAVPGHHLQFALQREMEDVPPFRRIADVGAFSEGWALYAERLGLEAGFYADPYSNFGRLTYEMWRACRLVVDTGLHAKGWTRQQAMDYMAANTALSLHEIQTETDRYIAWPGQALAYKIGELKIRELRARAERALGSRFDIRSFHDAVLANGPVPLSVLEEQIDAYVRAKR